VGRLGKRKRGPGMADDILERKGDLTASASTPKGKKRPRKPRLELRVKKGGVIRRGTGGKHKK